MFSVSQNRKHNNTSKHWCTAVDKYHSICISHDLIMERHVTGKCNQCTKTQAESEKHLSSCILPDIGILQQFPLQCNYTAMLSFFFFFSYLTERIQCSSGIMWMSWICDTTREGKETKRRSGIAVSSGGSIEIYFWKWDQKEKMTRIYMYVAQTFDWLRELEILFILVCLCH